MPENDESRAKLFAQRVIEARKTDTGGPIDPVGIAETPEARQRRFAARAPDGETPEQRTARYLEKARREGMLGSQTGPSGGNDVRNDVYGSMRENAAKASQGSGFAGKAQAWLDSIHKGTPEEDERIRATLRHVMNPLTISEDEHAAQDAQIEENARKLAILKSYQEPRDGGEIDATRQPIQMEREFPSSPQGLQDKEAYLQLVRQAQQNVK